MADLQHSSDHDYQESSITTIVPGNDEGPADALIVVLALLLVGFLIWFFGFSGVVFHGGTGSPSNVTITNNPIVQNTGGNTAPTGNLAPTST